MMVLYSENIIWKAFSPTTINSGRGAEFEGAIIALSHLLITRTDKVEALREAFYLQNITNHLTTVLVYFQGFRVVLLIRSKNARGQHLQALLHLQNANHSLVYSFPIPISFLSCCTGDDNFFVNILGKWKESEYSGGSVPVSGLAYCMTAPSRCKDGI